MTRDWRGGEATSPTISQGKLLSSPKLGSPKNVGADDPRLLQIAKNYEGVCGHLMASSRQMEEQIRSLRAEHEALLRCLDRTGVLRASEVAKEKKSQPSRYTPSASPASFALGTTFSNGQAATCEVPSTSEWPPLSFESAILSASHGALGSAASSSSPGSRGRDTGLSLESGETTDSPQDLFDLCKPLLNRVGSEADQKRSLREVIEFLKSNPEPPISWSGPGTPLSTAVRAGRLDLSRVLLRAGASPNERDSKGVGCLHLATFEGNVEVCRCLLNARADVDSSDRHRQTSLFFAPTTEICKLLVERKADIAILNNKGQTALHMAGRAGLLDVLAWLSARVARPVLDFPDARGMTARMYAKEASKAQRTMKGWDCAPQYDQAPLLSRTESVDLTLSPFGKASVSAYPVKNWVGSPQAPKVVSSPRGRVAKSPEPAQNKRVLFRSDIGNMKADPAASKKGPNCLEAPATEPSACSSRSDRKNQAHMLIATKQTCSKNAHTKLELAASKQAANSSKALATDAEARSREATNALEITCEKRNFGTAKVDVLKASVVPEDFSEPQVTIDSLREADVLCDGLTLDGTQRTDDHEEVDLADIGVLDDEAELADLGELNLSDLGIDLSNDMADVGVFEGEDDESLIAAGAFADRTSTKTLDSLPGEVEIDEEEEHEEDDDPFFFGATDDLEEDEEQPFDMDEECW